MFTDYIVDQIITESTTIKSFYLKPLHGGPIPAFLPGQYVNVKVSVPGIERELIRSYSLSDSPQREHLRLTIKKEPEGKVSSHFHDAVATGDVIPLSVALGNFSVTGDRTGAVVLLSGGVGITPLVSMAECIHENRPDLEVHFIHASKNRHVQPMLPRLQQIKAYNSNFHLSVFHTEPVADELVHTHYDVLGRIKKEHIPIGSQDTRYYVCGPLGFIKTIRGYLQELGVPDNQVLFEYFGGANESGPVDLPAKSLKDGIKVTLLKSGKEILWDESKGSLLELAESAGLTPGYSCRMGTCSTCESRLVKGTYHYDPEPFMEAAEGSVLICCAIPTSDIEIEL